MAQDLRIANALYNDVPSVSIPTQGGGSASFIDTSDANATAGDILQGKTAYVNGAKVTGTGTGGGGGTVTVDDELSDTSTNPVQNKVVKTNLDALANRLGAVSDQIPTKVSALENDAGYLTQHQSLADYAKKTDLDDYLPLSGGTLTGVVNGVTPPAGDNSKKIANTEFIQALANILVPTGCVQAYAGNTTPQGWLLCDGSAVSRTDYAALYAVIGDTYGAGDGTSTFNLPNLVDKFVGGSATAGTVKSAGLPNIIARYDDNIGFANDNLVGWHGAVYLGSLESSLITSDRFSDDKKYCHTWQFDASKSNPIYGNSTTVQPPALTMRYIIKY